METKLEEDEKMKAATKVEPAHLVDFKMFTPDAAIFSNQFKTYASARGIRHLPSRGVSFPQGMTFLHLYPALRYFREGISPSIELWAKMMRASGEVDFLEAFALTISDRLLTREERTQVLRWDHGRPFVLESAISRIRDRFGKFKKDLSAMVIRERESHIADVIIYGAGHYRDHVGYCLCDRHQLLAQA